MPSRWLEVGPRPGTGVRLKAWLLGHDCRPVGLWSETCGCQLHLRPESGRVDDRKLPSEIFFARSSPETGRLVGALPTRSSGAELRCPFFSAGLRVRRDRCGEGLALLAEALEPGVSSERVGRTCRGRASWTHGSPGPSAYLRLRPSKRLEDLSGLCWLYVNL